MLFFINNAYIFDISFVYHGITNLQAVSQLSMQDCNILGINAVADRKRFLMLTRSLRSQDSVPTSPRSGIPRSQTIDNHERPRRASTTTRSRPNSSYLDNLELDHVDEEEDYDIQYTKPNQLVNAYGIPVATSNRTKVHLGPIRMSESTITPGRKMTKQASSSSHDNLNQRIRVCVRKRPLSNKEIARNEKDITQAAGDCTIQVNEPK